VDKVKVNRTLDFIERVAWTFFEAEIGLGLLDWLSNGINLAFVHQVYISLGAAAAATIKVLIAQRVGRHKLGDAIPGGVLEVEASTGPTTKAR
jgi:hypothetical protein